MRFILLELSRIAIAAMMTTASIAMNAATSGNDAGQNPVQALTRQHNWVFGGYMVLIVLAAVFTYWVWRSGNRVQDAIQADAKARIEEAKSATAKIEQDNIRLRSDLAGLQTDAANAKTAQQKVETDLAKQQERAAKAEKDLATLRERMQPRHLTSGQQAALIKLLAGEPKGPVEIICVMGDGEGHKFAMEIDSVFKAAGWTVLGGGVSQGVFTGNPIGLWIVVRNAITTPPYSIRLQEIFSSVGLPLSGEERVDRPEGSVRILVGHKPNPSN
jgi:hypothetical protein